jgi:glycosyltransferase involved in cell wall biosynthesis
MSNVLISICIPTYNRAHYLRKCIESVLGYQTDDIEIIIQDNYSPDDTEQVVKSFQDKRIRYFRNQSNIGARLNVRTIINHAQGDYCLFLTDDDMLIPGAISEIKDFIIKHDPSAFKSDLVMYLEKSRECYIYSAIKKTGTSELTNQEKAKVISFSHILTGLCFSRKQLDFSFYDNNIDLWYPSELIIGSLNYKIGYIAAPTAIHTWENEIFWGIDNKNSELMKSEIEGILKLKSKMDINLHSALAKQFMLDSMVRDKNLFSLITFKDKLDVRMVIMKKKLIRQVKKILKLIYR